LGEAHTVGLIRSHPELHRVFSWDRRGWKELLKRGKLLTLLREMTTLVAEIRRERFDVVLDLQGLLRSGVASLLSGAGTRIVLRPREGSHLFATHVVDRHRSQGDPREVSSAYRYLARELGLSVEDFRMEVPLSERDRAFRDRILRDHGLESGFAVAVPFTTRPQKHWLEDRWALLTDRLGEELGLGTVILGGPGDREADGRIRELARGRPVSLVGETTLSEAAAIIERAELVVGVDTGLTHVGLALRRPVIGLFGSNVPYTRTFWDRARVLVHWLDCVPCKGNPTCHGDFTCLRLIEVEEVLGAAKELVDAWTPRGSDL
jgi:heptosyltransferase-1